MTDWSAIQHIVVLMLENRSFDNVLGHLRPAGPTFDGLDGADCAGNDGIAPWTTPPDADGSTMPDPDPGESFDDINAQLFNGPVTGVPPMSGFVSNYRNKGGNGADIMHGFTPAELPALTQLANSFAVSDRWFASAPCQTWPNRFFLHAGTANGYENNTLDGFPFPMQTIFNELQGVVPWKIYFHDFPQAALLSRLWPYFGNFRLIDEFISDAAAGQLPAYAFIEPRYYPDAQNLPNDMHPPHHVPFADALVARVYNAVRASPNWGSTLMIVTFDEHGGCFDHVAPPAATQPEPPRPTQRFTFDRFGVRVPAIIVSPYTAAGSVLRAAGPVPYDHTSIIKTIRNCFGIAGPLSAREAAAPDLSAALNAPVDPERSPASIAVSEPTIDPAALQAASGRDVTHLQSLLALVAKHLAPLGEDATAAQHMQDIIQSKTAPASQPDDAPTTAGAAGDIVRDVMQKILARSAAPEPPPAPSPSSTLYRGH
ncbi:alkaline phosphatase family protein [Paraburkholderia dinghuensis]|uniref:Phosphoesterase n=1 Tax=Paraburkholderia dinghuensis TaxID=2305225 RepID=A0A3N6NMG7_9BURK|nr:alkaline phosphatase family protein [Paraburkholderia dinghuensis]RQH00613.1 phosphoesterase [Paraburkholderia dinghuensis]